MSLSFYKCNQTLSPTWYWCGTWCWSWHCLYLTLAFSRMSWTCWWRCWTHSTNLVALLASVWAWLDASSMEAMGKATSVGANGWNPHARLKMAMAYRVVKGSVVAVMNIRQVIVPCVGVFIIVHPNNMYNHPIDYFYLSISLGMEGNWLCELGIHQWPEAGPECAEEPAIAI